LQARHSGRHVEVVRLEIVGEDLHRALFLVARLGMVGDVVGHGEELLVHQLLGPGHHAIPTRIAGAGEPSHEWRQRERALQGVHAADDVRRGAALGGGFLSGKRRGEGDEGDDDRGRWSKAHLTSAEPEWCCGAGRKFTDVRVGGNGLNRRPRNWLTGGPPSACIAIWVVVPILYAGLTWDVVIMLPTRLSVRLAWTVVG